MRGNMKIQDIIRRLEELDRFDLDNYREGDYGIDTVKNSNKNGEYILAYELDNLITELKNTK